MTLTSLVILAAFTYQEEHNKLMMFKLFNKQKGARLTDMLV